MTARPSRRTFLGVGAAVAGLGAAAAAGWRASGGWPSSSPAPPSTVVRGTTTPAAFFADPEAARRIGEAHLELAPEDDDVEHLSRVLGIGNDGKLDAAALRASVVSEFESGDVVMIDGWHLSRSGVRLCALVALSAG